jgi:hypothetical protein
MLGEVVLDEADLVFKSSTSGMACRPKRPSPTLNLWIPYLSTKSYFCSICFISRPEGAKNNRNTIICKTPYGKAVMLILPKIIQEEIFV